MSTTGIALVVGGIFAPLGGICAGIITYAEHRQHRLTKGKALQEALRSAGLAMFVLFAMTTMFGWLIRQS